MRSEKDDKEGREPRDLLLPRLLLLLQRRLLRCCCWPAVLLLPVLQVLLSAQCQCCKRTLCRGLAAPG
jgi:hypothetical protein